MAGGQALVAGGQALVAGSPTSAAGFPVTLLGVRGSSGELCPALSPPALSLEKNPAWLFVWVGAALSVFASFSTSLVSRNPVMPLDSGSSCCHSCLTTALWG